MTKRTELACLWCLPVGLLVFTVGWLASGYLPPPSPTISTEGLRAFFIHHAGGMRVGISLMAVGGMLTVPFTAALMSVMLRIKGAFGLAYTQLVMGGLGAVAFMVPLFPLAALAYRPYSDPGLIRTLNDMFWLPYVGAIWPIAGQAIAVGACALLRTNSNPLPRWFGYASLLCVAGLLPTVLLLSYKTGVLASNGLVGLWVDAVAAYLWYVLAMLVFHRAIVGRVEPDPTDRVRIDSLVGNAPAAVGFEQP